MPFEYRTAQLFEYQTNGRHLVFLCTGLMYWSYVLVLLFEVRISNGLVFKWSVLYKRHSLRRTIWIPNHLKSELQKVWCSNVSSIQMVGIQIPSVVMKNWKWPRLACLRRFRYWYEFGASSWHQHYQCLSFGYTKDQLRKAK